MGYNNLFLNEIIIFLFWHDNLYIKQELIYIFDLIFLYNHKD